MLDKEYKESLEQLEKYIEEHGLCAIVISTHDYTTGWQNYIENHTDLQGMNRQIFNNVHPSKFRIFLENQVERNKSDKIKHNHQFVLTNRPYLVDEFDSENVIVWYNHTTWEPLSNHPNWDKWEDEMMAGEFWSLVGEEWVNDKEE